MREGAEAPVDREKRFGGSPPERTTAQRWVLATQGILTELNGTSHLRVGGEPRPLCSNWSALRLREHWDVRDGEGTRRCLAWLFDEGHRFDFAQDLDLSPDELLAWDLVRASAVAGWGWVAYHLELDEAWGYMVRAARLLQRAFGSWADVGASYRVGRYRWSEGDKADGEIDELVATLTASGGGWDLPWDVDLEGEIPAPLDPLKERVVDPSGASGSFRTIGEAVAAHDEGLAGRIVVKAGRYDENVRITTAMELVADGEVTITCSSAAPIVARHNAYVRGFSLVSGTDDEGEAMQTVWVGGHFVRLVDCAMRSARCGIYAGKSKGHVVAERCRVESAAQNGFAVEKGTHLVLLDCAVLSPGGSGLYATGAGDVFVRGLRVSDATNPSVTIRGDNEISLAKLEIEGGAANGLELLGGTHGDVVDAIVRGSKATGVLLGSTEELHVRGARFEGSAANDLGLLKGSVHVEDSTIGGGAGCSVCAMGDAELRLDRCEILGSKYPSIWLDGTSRAVLKGTTVRAGEDFAVFAKTAAKGSPAVRAFGCTFEGSKKHAVVLRGVESALFVDSTFTGAHGALHVDESGRATLRGAQLRGGGTLVCVQKDADVAIVDGVIEATGEQAVAVESGARLALSRTRVTAPDGTALTIEGGRVRAVSSDWSGARRGVVDQTGPGDCPGESNLELVSDAVLSAVHPWALTLVERGKSALEIPVTALEPAFVAAGLEVDGAIPISALCPLWLGILLEKAPPSDPIELRRFGELAVVESNSVAALGLVAQALRDALLSGTRLEEIGAELRARVGRRVGDEDDEESGADEEEDEDELDGEDEEDEDEDEDEEEDEPDGEDEDEEDEDEDDKGPGALDA